MSLSLIARIMTTRFCFKLRQIIYSRYWTRFLTLPTRKFPLRKNSRYFILSVIVLNFLKIWYRLSKNFHFVGSSCFDEIFNRSLKVFLNIFFNLFLILYPKILLFPTLNIFFYFITFLYCWVINKFTFILTFLNYLQVFCKSCFIRA